jgi:hypothetical protein
MSGVRENFANLRDLEIRLEIVLGNDTIVKAAKHGTISFQRECMPPLVFRDVLYVSGLKKNIISVSSVIPILWITKEIMSRGPQVADMECRETT